jgi:hypothetical protein
MYNIYIYYILQQVQSNAAGALHNLAVNDEEAQATLLKNKKYSI